MRSGSHLRLAAALGLTAALVVLAGHVAGLDTGLLHLAPALLLVLPLLAGRYLGEDRLAALAGGRRTPARRPAGALRVGPGRASGAAVHGGALLAAGLARRGPPAALRA